MEKFKKFLKVFSDTLSTALMILSIIILIISIYTAIGFRDNPDESYLFGYKPVLVLTGSMEPTLKTNSVAIVKRSSYNDVKVNDILMYKIDGKMITHRIIKKDNKGIITKGDNNNVEDAYTIKKENVRAVVIAKLNFLARPISEIFPDGVKGEMNKFGFIKWIMYPIFVILVINLTFKAIRNISKKEKEEKKIEKETE